jgi:hypothetical protein
MPSTTTLIRKSFGDYPFKESGEEEYLTLDPSTYQKYDQY